VDAERTAGPSTALRSGRDDNFVLDRKITEGASASQEGFEKARRAHSRSLGFARDDKGRGFDSGGVVSGCRENSRSLHCAALRSG
jgi:hypothetical protein